MNYKKLLVFSRIVTPWGIQIAINMGYVKG